MFSHFSKIKKKQAKKLFHSEELVIIIIRQKDIAVRAIKKR